jgi:phytoene/squalene synthetase
MFLGGTDLREQASEGQKLKSIDDFNKSQLAGSDRAPVLDRLKSVMSELDIEEELFNQVIDGMKKQHQDSAASEADLLAVISQELGTKLKTMMKSIAAEQLRIN